MGRKRDQRLRQEPPVPMSFEDPRSRLPTEPWMKWAGANLWASIIVWFRMPKHIRGQTMSAALYTIMLVAGVVGAGVVIVLLLLFFDWIQNS